MKELGIIKKRRILIMTISMGLLLTILMGAAFAYMAPKINGTEASSTIVFNSGTIQIAYDNGSGQINAESVLPGWSVTKKFSLTATNNTSLSTNAMNYGLLLVVEKNTFSDNSIAVSLKSTNTSNNGTIAEMLPGTLLSGKSEVNLGYGSFDITGDGSSKSATHDFELTLSFPEQDRRQNSDMGKQLSAYVTIAGATDLGTLTIVDNYEKINKTTNVEKNKEINLLSLYSYPISKKYTIISGEGTITGNKLILTGDEMKISVSYPSITDTISVLDKDENGLEVDGTTDNNLRYVGASPKNYITFNDETWRIIGVFNVYNTESGKYEKLTKIIRNESLGRYSWDSSASSINSGKGINEWSQADLMTELNTDYINTDKTSGTTTWYNGANNSKTASYDYSKNIKSDSIDKIAKVRWNIGGATWAMGALDSYNAERGTAVTSNPADGVTRTTTWDGKIALMYPSDYGYASTNSACRNNMNSTANSIANCKDNNWLFIGAYQWTLSPRYYNVNYVFYAHSNGFITDNFSYYNYGVRPTLFLKSNVAITSGTGSESNPYKIEINESTDDNTTASFADDSWEKIASNIKNGKASLYAVGDEKEVEIDGESYTVRVANNSTPSECSQTDFSQTACGFVVEFVDIVEAREINASGTYNGKEYLYGWNEGSWPATEIRTYANGEFYNKLPSDLQKVIIDTKVITGHGSEDTTNFTSTDKIYLLSTHEVFEDESSSDISDYDTAYSQTRQLDYYKSKNVTTDENEALKKNSETIGDWWLRTPDPSDNYYYQLIDGILSFGSTTAASNPCGFAPAFRIG